ncbi:hypothetical protein QYE76_023166 [Lolium multiflorum]|uniref:Integrase catalytic domain-containing protein n=1 Tax=Lolium multiflorum TaxID=4521 RepID=A0AAD8RCS7_LOLMU|nr:hypothetical protein QYE76_023166 [Lolium multiflorum]
MLVEIHQGECGHHASSRALVAKVFRHGFYWPTALENAEDLVRKCNGCQRYAKQNHTPASGLKTIPLTWPFAVWCLDMVGPFKTARGNMTHILVMVDKFTKWLEVKPIAKCDGHTAVKFLKDVILRYGYPHSIITDNGSNFAQGEFKRFCEDNNIRLDLCSVAHPQAMAKLKDNALVLSGIKPRLIEPLEKSPGCWLDELPSVLWSIRTTPNRSTGYTPFFMVYGAEAVIPTDILHDSPRVQLYTEQEMEPYVQTETYDLENGGSLVFERDLYLVSERLERPPPKFHGVRIHNTPAGEQQWMITADLKGSSEPPISERILFSFKAYSWVDGLAHALQEGLARVCGQNIAALRGSRFAHFARHDTMGEPMALSSHPVLKIHATRQGPPVTPQRAKNVATITRLREKIRTLEVTVRTQQDQIQEMEEDGEDIQGGDDFLSDDNDFEDDEFTDEEDYEFLEAAEDGIIPIDVDEDPEE